MHAYRRKLKSPSSRIICGVANEICSTCMKTDACTRSSHVCFDLFGPRLRCRLPDLLHSYSIRARFRKLKMTSRTNVTSGGRTRVVGDTDGPMKNCRIFGADLPRAYVILLRTKFVQTSTSFPSKRLCRK